ncbi:unnamed protein product [Trichobilharzia regenti]|nr:unnamed protein product [Trichobilharzia regenti]
MASPVSQNGSHSIGELIAEHWFDPGNFTKTHFIMVAVAFVLACCIIKIIYSFRDFGINYVLEPISVFAIGLLFGKMANEFNLELTYFDEMTFFVLLLPPIIFEAVLHMHKSYFLQHITAILLFGFLGTLLNFALIGVSLVFVDDYFGVFKSEGLQITTLGYFLFSCLGSSVDSVIVLGILGEMRVHPSLYFIFVGESVINDGVTLAVFDYVYKVICHPSIHVSETTLEIILVGIFIVSAKIVIASLTGVVFGVFACIITRFTGHASAIEPLVVISGSYLTYLLNYSLHWPGVFSILLFWLIQSAYTFQNITPKSRMTIKRFARMTASISESLIFLTMGYTLVVHDFEWHTNFKLISLFLSILWRFIIVFILSVFVNKLHSLQNNLSKTTIFVLGFCGLRGAISHGLTEIVTQECLNNVGIDVNMLRSTSAFLTVFTIIIIGTLMKPLLHLLQMKQENKPTSLFQTLNQQVIWKMCACVDDILGTKEWGRRSSCVPKLERHSSQMILKINAIRSREHILGLFWYGCKVGSPIKDPFNCCFSPR